MTTLRRQRPLDSKGARTPMNREPRTDLYSADHLNGIARVTTISRDVDSSPLGDFRGVLPTTILGGKLGYRKHGAPHAALASLLAARRRPASSPQRRSSEFSCGNQDQNPADGVQTRVCEPPNALCSPL